MAATQQQNKTATTTTQTDPRPDKIDPTAPAGSENSLGEESVRDGRPATDDSIIEAIDEENPSAQSPAA